MLRMLSRENMVKHSHLVVIGKACLWVTTMQILCQFHHIIGVTTLWAVDVLHKVLTSLLAGEMLTTAVATKGQCALTSYDIPEVCTCCVVSLIATQLGYTFKTYHLRHLGVSMHIVENIATLHQRVKQSAM